MVDNSSRSEPQKNGIWQSNLLRFGTLTLLTLVVMYGAIGVFYSRPIVDDFCLAARADSIGVIGTVSEQYWNWSGNIIGLYYQVTGTAFQLYPIAPLLLLFLWVSTFTWFLWECFALAGLPRNRALALFLGILLTIGMVDLSPNIAQTLYWLNGTANYGPTSALFVMLLALLLRTLRHGAKRSTYIAAALLTFSFVCGQITTAIICAGLLAPLFLFAFFYRKLPHRIHILRVLFVALCAGAIGMAIVILTPGNDIRQAALSSLGLERMSIFGALLRNVLLSFVMLFFTFIFHGAVTHVLLFAIGHLGALILRPSALTERALPKHYRPLILLGGLGMGLSVFYFGAFAATYTTSLVGPPRAWAAPQSLWIIIVLLTGYLHGLCFQPISSLNEQRVSRVLMVCVGSFILFQLVQWISLIPPYQNFAHQHDTRIATIESAVERGETTVSISPYQPLLSQFILLDDSEDLLCLRSYYPIAIEERVMADE